MTSTAATSRAGKLPDARSRDNPIPFIVVSSATRPCSTSSRQHCKDNDEAVRQRTASCPFGQVVAGRARQLSALELVAGLEDPAHHRDAQSQKTDCRCGARGYVDVGDAEEAPAETTDEVDDWIEQRDLLPQRRQHADRVE